MPTLQLQDSDLTSLCGLHLYHHPASNAAMRPRLAMAEKGLSWTAHTIDLIRAENLKPEYLRIHPNGTVPALIHKGQAISNSAEILRYLEEHFPTPSLLPESEVLQEEMWRWVEFADKSHLQNVVPYLYANKMGRPCPSAKLPIYKKIAPDRYRFQLESGYKMTAAQKQQAIDDCHTLIADIDKRLGESQFLCGDTFTLADCAWGPNLMFFENFGMDLSPYPNVQRWLATLKSRDSYNDATKMPKIPLWLVRCLFGLQRLFMR